MTEKVTIGYCTRGYLSECFVGSLINMLMYDQDHEKYYSHRISVRGSLVTEARNRIVKCFLENGDDWLLFVDDDMEFSPDFLSKMMQSALSNHLHIVSALAFGILKNGEISPVWFEHRDGHDNSILLSVTLDSLKECTSVGMGGTLIHRDVLLKLQDINKDDPWPWFGHDICEDSTTFDRMGEDVTFCHRARKAGFKVWGYSGVQMGHEKQTIINLDTVIQRNAVNTNK